LLPCILFEKYIHILALEMASPGNQQCASCIGTLSFPTETHSDTLQGDSRPREVAQSTEDEDSQTRL